jgi:hypothetical protein
MWRGRTIGGEAFFNARGAGIRWRAGIKERRAEGVCPPLHLATSRPGRRWLVRRVYVMWGRVFDDALATRDVSHT